MPSLIALLGAPRSGRHALLHGLQSRLGGLPLRVEVVEDVARLRLPPPPALVLLLPPKDTAGEAHDLRYRGELASARLAFSVLHGDAQPRLDGAWRLIQPLLGQSPAQTDEGASGGRCTWSCEKCSDPACEHRLFQDLVQGRRGGPGY